MSVKRVGIRLRFQIACGLALTGALAAGLLPGGFLPKIAGPCGRELCDCPIQSRADFARSNDSHAAQSTRGCGGHCAAAHVASARGLTFVSTNISNADAPGVALQLVYSGMLAPSHIQIQGGRAAHRGLRPCSRNFALLSVSREIHTPPPRASRADVNQAHA